MKRVSILLLASLLLANACASLAPPKITVAFPADGKCTMQGSTTILSGKDITLEVIGNIPDIEGIGLAILRLDPDKTLKDLEALSFDDPQPPWTLRIGFYDFPSDGNVHSIVLNQAIGPLYFLCMTPSAIVGALGPLEVK